MDHEPDMDLWRPFLFAGHLTPGVIVDCPKLDSRDPTRPSCGQRTTDESLEGCFKNVIITFCSSELVSIVDSICHPGTQSPHNNTALDFHFFLLPRISKSLGIAFQLRNTASTLDRRHAKQWTFLSWFCNLCFHFFCHLAS